MFLPSLILSLVAAVSIWLLGRRNPARNPSLTGSVLLLMLLLPLLNFLPKYGIEITTGSHSGASSQVSSYSLIGLWLAGVSFFSFRTLRDLFSMRQWHKQSHQVSAKPLLAEFQTALAKLEVTQAVKLHTHPSLKSPVIAGILTPTIYLPEDAARWPKRTLQMALLHELAHFQRRDLWLAMIAQLTCIFHWFNPLSWWLRRTLISQCEYACDAYLLKKGTDRKSYAHALCDVAQTSSTPALALAMAGHVPLKERIIQLSTQKRAGSAPLTALLTVTATSAIAMSVTTFVSPKEETSRYTPVEIETRLSANPFPLD